jgi:hypothetical protein
LKKSAVEVVIIITKVAIMIANPSISPPHPLAIAPQSPERRADPATTHHILSLAVCFIDSIRVGTLATGFLFYPKLKLKSSVNIKF